MCGIFGIVSDHDRELGDLLLEAGRRLAYRGYDSIGCATIDGKGEIDLRKDAWVLGSDVGTTAVQSQMSQLTSGISGK